MAYHLRIYFKGEGELNLVIQELEAALKVAEHYSKRSDVRHVQMWELKQ
jgi:hypothetical protein